MKRSRGFTLIELIVAMVLIVIVSIASLEFFKYCYGNFLVPDELKLEAVNYARGSMETIYMQDYTSSDLNDTSGAWVEDTPAPGGSLAIHSAHKKHSVTVKNAGTDTEYKVISTKVEWTR